MRHLVKTIIIGTLLAGCQQEPYDTGDTSLSYLNAEMVSVHVKGAEIVSIVNDADEQFPVPPEIRVSEALVHKDSTYRMMMYYVREGNDDMKILRSQMAMVMNISDNAVTRPYLTDPVTMTSAWMAENGKYLNLSIGVRTGVEEDKDAAQTMALVTDSVKMTDGGRCRRYVTLSHDQSTVPQFYTTTLYICIPTEEYPDGDEITLRVNTYDGEYVKTFRK